MNLVTVSSSNLAAVGYDVEASVLRVLFQSGRLYEYYSVPANVHGELMNADSKDSFFRQHIKDVFEYQEVTSGKDGHYDGKKQAADRSRNTRKEVRHSSTSTGSRAS